MTRISTQVYVLVDGQRKQMEHIAPDGTRRPLCVDIDLADCDICGSFVADVAVVRHAKWHQNGAGSAPVADGFDPEGTQQ